MKFLASISILLPLLLTPHISNAGIYFDIDLFAYSETMPVKSAIDGWQDTPTAGSVATTHNWSELGATYNDFRIGYFQRYDYEIKFNSDTIEFIHRIKNEIPLEPGKTYDLNLIAKNFFADGIHIQYEFGEANDFSVTLGFSYLNGYALTNGDIQGSALALSDSDYDFAFDVDYYYSEDSLFDRKTDKPNGRGYSTDVFIEWKPTERVSTSLKIIDLMGWIHWFDAPHTTANASSNNKSYDEDGYLIYQPVLSGFETNDNFQQRLKPITTLEAAYDLNNNFFASGKLYDTEFLTLYQIGGGYQVQNNYKLNLMYTFKASAISLEFAAKNFAASISSDKLKLDEAKLFRLNLSVIADF